MSLTLSQYIQGVSNQTLDPVAAIQTYLSKAHADPYNAYITIADEYIQDRLVDQHFLDLPLHGAPLCLKDNICTQGVQTTCASKILSGYIPPYSATCFHKLEQAGAMLIAKANMDEFAMGSSNENSAYGPSLNPYDPTRVTGGSSGGVVAAVAGDLCICGLGTDTGGSIRQPAALGGIVGLKPTYGRVSRYGVMPMSNSLDQVGTLTKTVEDAKILLSYMSGYDTQDAMSVDKQDHLTRLTTQTSSQTDLKGVRIAVFHEFFDSGLDPSIAEQIRFLISKLQDQGAVIEYIHFPLMSYCLPVYYVLCPAEVSTNLARLDGIKYGLQGDTSAFASIQDYSRAMRSAGFGEEAQRRIMVGSYILSSTHFQDYYMQAVKMRTLMTDMMIQIFNSYDLILGPTSPEVAREIGRKSSDPVAMYLSDIYTVLANLTGIPAMSIPCGYKQVGDLKLPIGCQLMSIHWREDLLFGIGQHIEHLSQA